MNSKIPVFIISGKSPLDDPGGYPAYAHTLSRMLHLLKYQIYTLAIGEKTGVTKTAYGEIHFLTTKLLKILPVLRHLALAALPYYGIIFAKEIRKITKEKNINAFIIWGMGPWAFPGVLLKLFLPKNVRIIMITSYFTSTRHEMRGALNAIRVKDYGIIPKIRYFLVYEVVARIFHVFEKITLDYCDSVVIHYKSSRNIIKKYFNVEDKKIKLFPWHTEIFKRKSKKNFLIQNFKHPLIVSICRQDPRKGINFLIRAIEIVSKEIPSVQCLIVGSGSFLTLNKRLVEKLGLEKNVKVTGFVSDITPILKNADIAVIVPLAQGSSALTVLEAMSFGKAIIGSDCDGIPEDLIHNKTGIIIKKGDEKALAKAIIDLTKNDEFQKKLGKNAYSAYKKRFGFNKMMEHIKKILSPYSDLADKVA